MNVANELRDHLQTFDDYLRTLGKKIQSFFFFLYKNIFFHLRRTIHQY
jgi:hypothetical protein